MFISFPNNNAERSETRELHSVLLPDERAADRYDLFDLTVAILHPTFDKLNQSCPSDVLAPAEVNPLEIGA